MDEKIYIQFSECGQHIRKWSRKPFDGASANVTQDGLDFLDDWAKSRVDWTLEQANKRYEEIRCLDDPEYRVLLGQNQAYNAMRSFIHGSRSHPTQCDRSV